MLYTLQAVADEHDTDNHNEGGEVDWKKTGFGLKAATVASVDNAGKIASGQRFRRG